MSRTSRGGRDDPEPTARIAPNLPRLSMRSSKISIDRPSWRGTLLDALGEGRRVEVVRRRVDQVAHERDRVGDRDRALAARRLAALSVDRGERDGAQPRRWRGRLVLGERVRAERGAFGERAHRRVDRDVHAALVAEAAQRRTDRAPHRLVVDAPGRRPVATTSGNFASPSVGILVTSSGLPFAPGRHQAPRRSDASPSASSTASAPGASCGPVRALDDADRRPRRRVSVVDGATSEILGMSRILIRCQACPTCCTHPCTTGTSPSARSSPTSAAGRCRSSTPPAAAAC